MNEGFVHIDLAIPGFAETVLAALESAGFDAWVVGGYVRDAVLARPCNDVDIATSAHWTSVRDVMHARGMKTFETGVEHGTITVACHGHTVEVTTYRTDGAYSDARHPDCVTFVGSIEEDLARRDFTMNALAYNPKHGVVDPFGGMDAIRAHEIATVGDASKRFGEDALRILRAVRFASELGFSIEPATFDAARRLSSTLANVSVERQAAELTKLISGQNAREVLIGCPEVIDAALPELSPMRGFDQKSPYHIYDVYEHTAHVVEGIAATPLLRWAALLHDAGKPTSFSLGSNGQGHFYGHAAESARIASRVMGRLKMPAALSRDVVALVRFHDVHQKPSPKAVKRLLHNLGGNVDLFRALCQLQRADALAHAPGHRQRAEAVDEMESHLTNVLANNEAFSLKDLAINGNDILACGIQAGPEVGSLLDSALDAVIDGLVPNERDSLLAYIEGL